MSPRERYLVDDWHVLCLIGSDRLYIWASQADFKSRSEMLKDLCVPPYAFFMLVPSELYALWQLYSLESAREDWQSAGVVHDWLNDDDNARSLREINKGTAAAEMIPYIRQWMTDVFHAHGSAKVPFLPGIEDLS